MNKVTAFLEKYAQWIALGAAGLWVLFVVYTYWLKDPVTVSLAGKPVGPGEVDAQIVKEGLEPLQKKLNEAQGVEKLPNNPVMYDKAFKDSMAKGASVPVDPPFYNSHWQAGSSPTVVVHDGTGGTTNPSNVTNPGTKLVENLPKLPLPVIYEMTSGRILAWVNGPPGAAAPAAPAFGAPPPAAGGPPALGMVKKDVMYASVFAWIQEAEIMQAYQATGIRKEILAQNPRPVVLGVELQRQEKLADGSWGEWKSIKTFPTSPQWPMPTDPTVQKSYQATLQQGGDQMREAILHPPFWQPANADKGNLWETPEIRNQRIYDTRQAAIAEEARKAAEKAAEDARIAAEREAKKAGTGGGGGVRQPPRGGAFEEPPRLVPDQPGDKLYYVEPAGRSALAQQRPVVRPEDMPGAGEVFEGAVDPGITANGVIKLWAHDDSCEAGKTYRYRVRVRFLNPMYGRDPRLAKDPSIVTTFALPVGPSEGWSKETGDVTMPSNQYFYVVKGPSRVNGKPQKEAVTIEQYNWQDGGWQVTQFDAGPGDTIPNTPYTVGDLRFPPSDVRLLMADTAGRTVSRSLKQDYESEKRHELQGIISARTAAAAAGAVEGIQ